MFRRFINWLKGDSNPRNRSTPQQRRRISAHKAIRPKPTRSPSSPQPKRVFDPYLPAGGAIKGAGDGKSALIRNKFVREDTGTHETLRIMDDSMVDSGEEYGVDPYNSGEFDRSKNWDVRFRS